MNYEKPSGVKITLDKQEIEMILRALCAWEPARGPFKFRQRTQRDQLRAMFEKIIKELEDGSDESAG